MKYMTIMRTVKTAWNRAIEFAETLDYSPMGDAYRELARLQGEVEALRAEREQRVESPDRHAA